MRRKLCIIILGGVIFGCGEKDRSVLLTITNSAEFPRKQETVSVQRDQIEELVEGHDVRDILVRELGSDRYLVTQWVDYDQDSVQDELIFQVDMAPSQDQEYEIIWKENGRTIQPESETTTYSRFVPERTDDYTWENDRVAFRTFGPEAQRLIEANEAGGTLTSGIDLWLKKVNYSIIDSWYAKNDKDPGYYHIEHGEGHDPYHVGKSRGTGGGGVWLEDTLLTSKNFTAYRTIATGPLRTVFELDYAPWSEFGISETKRISLDLGSNFSKVEITITSESAPPNYAIGITQHAGGGDLSWNKEQGWIRHWETIDSVSFVGEGVIVNRADIQSVFVQNSETPDQSHLLVLLNPRPSFTYFAGFSWTESGQVYEVKDWEEIIQHQAQIIAHPIKIEVK